MTTKQKNQSEEIVDVAIVGGGMIGSSLALALDALPLTVAIIDPYPQNSDHAPGFDARAIALSWGSTRIFNSLNLWDDLKKIATPIHKIHISDKGHPGITRLNAEQFNLNAMGQVVELEDVGKVIHKAINKTTGDSSSKQFCPAKVINYKEQDAYTELTLETTGHKRQTLKAKLVVAADGNQSTIREMAGINTQEKPYAQIAIISTIQTQLPHNNVAFERFTETGPVAFLPLSKNRISLVWMMQKSHAELAIDASEADFIKQLQEQFGYRLGKITRIGKRYSYPLTLKTAATCIGNRLAIVGNAAQSLHPIAGQGFNLGLRDVANLADVIRDACKYETDIGSTESLNNYQQSRVLDQKKVIGFTDSMARLFANPSKLLSTPRNLVLMAMNLIPEMRSLIAEGAMGISGKQPRLARDLTLELNSRAKQ